MSTMVETDRISQLPEEIVDEILRRLGVRTIVQMSILSRTWNQLCAASTSIFRFELNWHNMFATQRNLNSPHRCPDSKDIFVGGVNQLVQFNTSPLLFAFTISFCLGMESASGIDAWVRFALRKGVRSLGLHLSCPQSEEKGGTSYIFHPALLLSDANRSRLRQLSLRSCILGEGLFEQLTSLEQMDLAGLTVGQHQINTILCSCVKLSSLRLHNCTLPTKLCISEPLSRLKILGIALCRKVQEIQLFAADLFRLEYQGDGRNLITFSAVKVPKLTQLLIRGHAAAVRSLLSELPPHHFFLTVVGATKWVRRLPDYISCQNVRLLAMDSPNNDTDLSISTLNIILKACPLLNLLSLAAKECKSKEKHYERVVHQNLTRVHLFGFSQIWNQIGFVKHLLNCAVSLQVMTIDPQNRVRDGIRAATFTEGELWLKTDRRRIRRRLRKSLKATTELVIR